MSRKILKAPITDEQIIELFWQRDESAIASTDKKYGKYLYTVAFNILHDRLDCEECQNSTYLGAWNSIPPDRPNLLKAYLTKIMRRVAINRYKERSRQKRVPSELTEALSELEYGLAAKGSVEQEVDATELSRVLNDYLRSLSDRELCIFLSRYYFADSVKEIAASMNVTQSGIYKQLSSIRKQLLEHLRREGFEL